MAKKEHWNVDPWNEQEVWSKLIGQPNENIPETLVQVDLIMGKRWKIPRGLRCLEVGAGIGRLLKHLQPDFIETWGTDSSPMMVALSTRYLQDAKRSRIVLSDGKVLPFPSDHFDFVYSFTCFQHMEELETIQQNLREIFRVLEPRGEFCIQTVCGSRMEQGRYDGYVFNSAVEFCKEIRCAGFNTVTGITVGEWIWARGVKE